MTDDLKTTLSQVRLGMIEKWGIGDMPFNDGVRHMIEAGCPEEEVVNFYVLMALVPLRSSLAPADFEGFMAALDGPERPDMVAALMEIIRSAIETKH